MVLSHFLRRVRTRPGKARANEKHDRPEPIVLLLFQSPKPRLFGCDHGVGGLLEGCGVIQHPKRVQVDLQDRVFFLAFVL